MFHVKQYGKGWSMAIEDVRAYLCSFGRDKDIIEMNTSTATVAEAAVALGVIPARIAKSISLKTPARNRQERRAETAENDNGEEAVMVVVIAGDMKLDNRKYKDRFGVKAKMLSPDEALRYTGHAVGGVCPFALPAGVEVYLDSSMKRFRTVFPACGSGNSAIELTMDELQKYSRSKEWVDLCKPIEAAE
jgi:prolyl-tRNA editing enzyme YbaK/EbsC (Cys-tRNA(Pro) deacylase)